MGKQGSKNRGCSPSCVWRRLCSSLPRHLWQMKGRHGVNLGWGGGQEGLDPGGQTAAAPHCSFQQMEQGWHGKGER